MFFLLYLLGDVYTGKVGGVQMSEPLLNVAFLVEGDSPQDIAEKLGAEYDARYKDIFVPISVLEEEAGTGTWKYEQGNIRFEVPFDHLHADPYRPDGLKLEVRQVECFSGRVKEAV